MGYAQPTTMMVASCSWKNTRADAFGKEPTSKKGISNPYRALKKGVESLLYITAKDTSSEKRAMRKACPFFMNNPLTKRELRKKAREIRKQLSPERRLPAAHKVLEILLPRLQEPTLSFSSFDDE